MTKGGDPIPARLRLTLALLDSDLVRPLLDGTVRADGIDFVPIVDDEPLVLDLARHREVDVGEINASLLPIGLERGEPWIGLAVFPHRRFRHGSVFVDPAKGIKAPRDLIGRKVAVGGGQPAAVFWLRGMLGDEYGVPWRDVTWLHPPGILGAATSDGRSAEQLLLDGDADAFVGPSEPSAFRRGDPRVARLFPDYEERDKAYFMRTGFFPIMHALTVRSAVVAAHPWAPALIARAFAEAKGVAYSRAARVRGSAYAFAQRAWEEQQRVLGADPWSYGLTPDNRRNMSTLVRYIHEQGRISRQPDLEEMFVALDEAVYR